MCLLFLLLSRVVWPVGGLESDLLDSEAPVLTFEFVSLLALILPTRAKSIFVE